MAAVAYDDPPSPEVLNGYEGHGRAWVATAKADRPVAYLLIDVVDAAAHVEQVSVHLRHAGRRLGSAPIDVGEGWAAQRHLRILTLTTFAKVPWNAPYYARLGFHVLAEHELSVGLRRIRQNEAAQGLDRCARVAMVCPVTPIAEPDSGSPSR